MYKDRWTNYWFKTEEGTGVGSSRWTVCMSRENGRCTAELYFMGGGGANQALYEINKDIFDQAGTFEDDDYKTENLIKENGRCLFEGIDERQTIPHCYIHDKDYKEICPWADIMGERNE